MLYQAQKSSKIALFDFFRNYFKIFAQVVLKLSILEHILHAITSSLKKLSTPDHTRKKFDPPFPRSGKKFITPLFWGLCSGMI